MNTETCTTCPWWYESPKELLPEEWKNSKDLIGQCRFSPPVFLNNSQASVGYWPSIDGNFSWCKEHPARKVQLGSLL